MYSIFFACLMCKVGTYSYIFLFSTSPGSSRTFFSMFAMKCHRRELARTMIHGISTWLNDFNSVRSCATSCFAVSLLSVLRAINLRFFRLCKSRKCLGVVSMLNASEAGEPTWRSLNKQGGRRECYLLEPSNPFCWCLLQTLFFLVVYLQIERGWIHNDIKYFSGL